MDFFGKFLKKGTVIACKILFLLVSTIQYFCSLKLLSVKAGNDVVAKKLMID